MLPKILFETIIYPLIYIITIIGVILAILGLINNSKKVRVSEIVMENTPPPPPEKNPESQIPKSKLQPTIKIRAQDNASFEYFKFQVSIFTNRQDFDKNIDLLKKVDLRYSLIFIDLLRKNNSIPIAFDKFEKIKELSIKNPYLDISTITSFLDL